MRARWKKKKKKKRLKHSSNRWNRREKVQILRPTGRIVPRTYGDGGKDPMASGTGLHREKLRTYFFLIDCDVCAPQPMAVMWYLWCDEGANGDYEIYMETNWKLLCRGSNCLMLQNWPLTIVVACMYVCMYMCTRKTFPSLRAKKSMYDMEEN